MVKYCTECGYENLDEANFCADCGFPFDENIENNNMDANVPLEIPEKYFSYSNIETTTCINCRQNTLIHLNKSSLLSDKNVYFCSNCGIVFEKSGNSYKLMDILDKNNPMWKLYKSRSYKMEEWIRIANGAISDSAQNKRNKKIESLRQELIDLERKQDIENIIQDLTTGKTILHPDCSSLELKTNEEACLCLNNIILSEFEDNKNINYDSSFKLVKGVSRSLNVPQKKLNQKDIGRFIITNRRIIFKGENNTFNIDLRKILSINIFKDGISIQRKDKKKAEYFSGTNQNTFNFNIHGREHELALEGNIIRAMILGQMLKL